MTAAAKSWVATGLPTPSVGTLGQAWDFFANDRAYSVERVSKQTPQRFGVVAVVLVMHVLVASLLLHQRQITQSVAPPLTTILLSAQMPPPVKAQPMVTTSMAQPTLPSMSMPELAVTSEESRPITVTEVRVDSAPTVSHSASVTTSLSPGAVTLNEADVDYLQRPQVRYPMASKRALEQGTSWLRVSVDPEGRVTSVVLTQSSGYARLDEAALRALRITRFRPHIANGTAIPVDVIVPVEFSLLTQG